MARLEPLLHQVNRKPDVIMRYRGYGEKCILRALSSATEGASPKSPGRIFDKICGIPVAFAGRGTVCCNLAAKRAGFKLNVRREVPDCASVNAACWLLQPQSLPIPF
jgi:hypothetical protein